MGSAFHQLYPRYNGTLTPTAPTAIRLRETFTFSVYACHVCLVITIYQICKVFVQVSVAKQDRYKIQESLLQIFSPHRSTYRHGISVTKIR